MLVKKKMHRNIVQSVSRALNILSLYSRQTTQLGITEISHELGLSKAATHGIVNTLMENGFICQDPKTRKYSLGLKIFELAMIQPQARELNQHAAGPSAELARARKMITRVAIWDGDAVLITLTNYPQNRPEMSGSIGPRIYAHASSLGKAILSQFSPEKLSAYLDKTELVEFTPNTIFERGALIRDLDEARKRGYSIDREESMLGVACLGAPIISGGQALFGAISVSGTPQRILEEKKTEDLSRELMITAAAISRSLGYLPDVVTDSGYRRLQP